MATQGDADFDRACALCCRKVSRCALMPCRLFLSISLAAAEIFEMRKLSGNQMIFAVSVMAGTYRGKQRQRKEKSSGICKKKMQIKTTKLQNTFLQTSSNDL